MNNYSIAGGPKELANDSSGSVFSLKNSADCPELLIFISGLGLLLFQLLLYPPVEKILGPIATTRLSAVSFKLYHNSFAFLTLPSQFNCQNKSIN